MEGSADQDHGVRHGVRYSCPLRPESRKPLEDVVIDRAVALGKLYAVEHFYSELIKRGVGDQRNRTFCG